MTTALPRLQRLFADLLRSQRMTSRSTSAETLSEWDSLKHLQLMLMLEEEFHPGKPGDHGTAHLSRAHRRLARRAGCCHRDTRMSLDVRYAQLDDYPRLSAFLDTYWAKDHVYVRQRSLFDWTFGRRDLWAHDGYSFAWLRTTMRWWVSLVVSPL